MLKPMLARGELHMVGATTVDEYRKYIEKDAALERRVQPILVDEPSVEDTISILRGLRERFEVFHGVKIQDRALVRAVVLSHRYIADRFLPGQGDRPRRRGMRDAPDRDRFDAVRARRADATRDAARDRGSRALAKRGRRGRGQRARRGAARTRCAESWPTCGAPKPTRCERSGNRNAKPCARFKSSESSSNRCATKPTRPSASTTSTAPARTPARQTSRARAPLAEPKRTSSAKQEGPSALLREVVNEHEIALIVSRWTGSR